VTYQAVNAVVNKATMIVAEDLSRTFTGRNKRGADTNRRLAAWTKGVTAEALRNVSGGRGSVVRLVNAAYTSQVIPGDGDIGRHTPHWRVKQIIQERADRQRSRLPDQDSNTTGHCRCGERNIQSAINQIKE
jgi:hypothetical protein